MLVSQHGGTDVGEDRNLEMGPAGENETGPVPLEAAAALQHLSLLPDHVSMSRSFCHTFLLPRTESLKL